MSSWLQCGGSDLYAVSTCGDRQGCRFGINIFNFSYELALKEIRRILKQQGMAVSARGRPGSPPWAGVTADDAQATSFDVTDVTFVDDEAVAITASSSIALVERIAFVVETVVSVF